MRNLELKCSKDRLAFRDLPSSCKDHYYSNPILKYPPIPVERIMKQEKPFLSYIPRKVSRQSRVSLHMEDIKLSY